MIPQEQTDIETDDDTDIQLCRSEGPEHSKTRLNRLIIITAVSTAIFFLTAGITHIIGELLLSAHEHL